jgi:anti-sigma B factor antagonist
MSLMNFTEQPVSDRVTTITLGTILDNNNAESVVQTIVKAQERGCKFVVVDCERLEFLSSAGVGVILGTIEAFRDQGGDIVLCNLSETINHVLRVLDLLDFLTIRQSRQEALAACEPL